MSTQVIAAEVRTALVAMARNAGNCGRCTVRLVLAKKDRTAGAMVEKLHAANFPAEMMVIDGSKVLQRRATDMLSFKNMCPT